MNIESFVSTIRMAEHNRNYTDDFMDCDVAEDYIKFQPENLNSKSAHLAIDLLKQLKYSENTKVGGSLLNVGCGHDVITRILAKDFKNVVGTDIRSHQIIQATKATNPPNVEFKICSSDHLPFGDPTIDFTTASTHCTSWTLTSS